MAKKSILIHFALCFIICLSCSVGSTFADTNITPRIGEKTDHGTINVYDSAGRWVEVPYPLHKVVALNSGVPEMMIAMDAGNAVIGIDQYLKPSIDQGMYPELANLTVTGSYEEPDIEGIVALHPDAVITFASWPMYPDDLQEKLKEFNIPVIALDFYRVETFNDEIGTLGSLLGKQAEAERLQSFFEENRQLVTDRVSDIPEKERVSVYYEGSKKYQSYGGGGYGAGMPGMVKDAGAREIFPDIEIQYFDADPEDVADRNPEIIVKGHKNIYSLSSDEQQKTLKETYDELISRPELQKTEAIKNNRVLILSFDTTGYQRKPFGPLFLAKFFYPEKFADVNPDTIYDRYLTEFLGMPKQPHTHYPDN